MGKSSQKLYHDWSFNILTSDLPRRKNRMDPELAIQQSSHLLELSIHSSIYTTLKAISKAIQSALLMPPRAGVHLQPNNKAKPKAGKKITHPEKGSKKWMDS